MKIKNQTNKPQITLYAKKTTQLNPKNKLKSERKTIPRLDPGYGKWF